eukprot:CAMPEP_0170166000 /NCGR_PEP_ID=MMETSP0033_2-20121228/78885_1 /TAXON_ID=195969 /ORGANISM="Dolichomastix tenuilepis, Strain CCMP3274" /LENGTH=250 /DNA_ID=CAMNT_0010403653 /DNA_START=487 /DNA_END=1236 /DNA_ORIENTATION=-
MLYAALRLNAAHARLVDEMVTALNGESGGGDDDGGEGGARYVAIHLRCEREYWEDVKGRRAEQEGAEWVSASMIRDRFEAHALAVHPNARVLFLTYGPGLQLEPGEPRDPALLFDGRRVETKHTLLGREALAGLTAVARMAVDFEVCKRAAAYVGTSRSTFDNLLAQDRAHARLGPSYLFNHLPSPAIVMRTDAGLFPNPADAIGAQAGLTDPFAHAPPLMPAHARRRGDITASLDDIDDEDDHNTAGGQ